MAYASSTTYLLTKLPQASLYNYKEKQMELFHIKWFNCRLGWFLCEMPEVGASAQTFL